MYTSICEFIRFLLLFVFILSSKALSILALFQSSVGQAHKWVVNMEKESGLQVVKQTDPAFMNILEKSLEKGLPLLIEGVGEELDPILGKYCYSSFI